MTTNLSARTWPVWARTGDEWRPLEQSPRPVPIGNEVPHSGPSGRRLRAGELPPHLVGLERTQQPASIARNCHSRRRELAAGAPIQSVRGRAGGAGRSGHGLGHEGACRDLPLAPSEPRTDYAGTRRVHARIHNSSDQPNLANGRISCGPTVSTATNNCPTWFCAPSQGGSAGSNPVGATVSSSWGHRVERGP